MTSLPIKSLILNMRKAARVFKTHFKNYGLQSILQMGLDMENESSVETNSLELSIHSQTHICSDG
jgi:hypothetical protein